MEIFNTINEMEQKTFTICKHGYIKELNIYVSLNDCCLRIIKLDNALKTGKTCDEIVVTPESYRNSFENDFLDYRNNTQLGLDQIVNNILASDFKSLQNNGFEIEIRLERKGVDTFSPFAEVKPLSKVPSKWTKANIVKAILAGQIFKGVKAGTYTDDYAGDASCNFGKGIKLDLLELAGDLTNGSSQGWRFRVDKEENGIIQLSADCYSFDYNTLYFDITCDSREKAQEVISNEDQERENNNKSLENECIEINIAELDKNAIYEVEYLVMDNNTKEYKKATRKVNYYSLVNEEYNEMWSMFWHILKLEIVNINNSDIFKIGDMRDYRLDVMQEDSRLIISAISIYVTGKALKELCIERDSFSNIQEINSHNLLSDIIKEQKGILFSMFPSDKELEIQKINMLDRFTNELKRASEGTKPTPPEDKQPLPKEQIKKDNNISNVIQVDFTASKGVKAELQGEATKRQLWAIHCITKVNTTGLNISKQTASELIEKSKEGINITEEVKALLNQNIAKEM